MNPFYQGARFLTAATRIEQAPEDQGREVVFAGRSNAGKSSAINAILGRRGLAREAVGRSALAGRSLRGGSGRAACRR